MFCLLYSIQGTQSISDNHLVNPWREKKKRQRFLFIVLLHRCPQDLVVLWFCCTARDSGHSGIGWFVAAASVVTLCQV